MLKIEKAITWRESLKKGSVWLALIAGPVAGAIVGAVPGLVLQALTAPLATRIIIAIMIAIGITGSAWSSRVLSISKKGSGDGTA